MCNCQAEYFSTTKGSYIIPPSGPTKKEFAHFYLNSFYLNIKNKQKHRIFNFSDLCFALQMHAPPVVSPSPTVADKKPASVWFGFCERLCSRADSMEADQRLQRCVLHSSIYWEPLWFSSCGLHISFSLWRENIGQVKLMNGASHSERAEEIQKQLCVYDEAFI